MTAYPNDEEKVQPAETADHSFTGVLSHLFSHRLNAEPKPNPLMASAGNAPVTTRPQFDKTYWTPQYPAQYVMPDTHHEKPPLGDNRKDRIPYRDEYHGIDTDLVPTKDYRPVGGPEANDPFDGNEEPKPVAPLVTHPVDVRVINEQQPQEVESKWATNKFSIAGAASAPFATQLLTGRRKNRTRIVIVAATGTTFIVGPSAEELANGVMGVLVPANTPMELFGTEPLYCANTGAATGVISYIEEFVVDQTKKVD